ncbi:MAG TPA: hypothetical protein VI756_20435 [Blastocatellia bacterium]
MYTFETGAPDWWLSDREKERAEAAERARQHEERVNAKIDAWGRRIRRVLQVAGKVLLFAVVVLLAIGGGLAGFAFALAYRRYPAGHGYRRPYRRRL